MPRYGLVWLEIAREQYTSLPADAREQIDTRVEQLLRTPGSNPAPPTTGAPTSGPPGAGLIVYAVVHNRQRVIILRLV